MDYADICPYAVVQRIEQTDLAAAGSGGLLSWVADQGKLDCTVSAVAAIAERLPPDADLAAVDDFASAVATYGRFLEPDQMALVRAAFLRAPYYPAISFNYFLALRKTGIDIRDHLRLKVRPDWGFTHPRQNAATWDYHLYLASLGDAEALRKMAEKIAETPNGNDAWNLLDSLAELTVPGVDDILRRYLDDSRRIEGAEGPTAPVGDMVKMRLMLRGAQP